MSSHCTHPECSNRAENTVAETNAPVTPWPRENAGLRMKYFVVKPNGRDIHAKASRAAIRAYARVIRQDNPNLASDLDGWASLAFANAWAEEMDAHQKIEEEIRDEQGR